jgi:Flp pilus assembly protein TadD
MRTLIGVVAIATAACGGGTATHRESELSKPDQIRLAQSMMQAGRTGESLTIIHDVLRKFPDDPDVHSVHGQLAFQAGKYQDAEQAFRRALELDPYRTDAHNYLGVVATELGRYDEAEEHYKKALADPSYPTPELVRLNLGLLYARQGRDNEAISEFRRAVEISPRFYKGHFELASVLDRTGRLDEAAREYEVAEPGYRGFGEYHYRLGLTYYRLGDRDRAREHLSRAIDVAPGSPSAAQADELLRMMR